MHSSENDPCGFRTHAFPNSVPTLPPGVNPTLTIIRQHSLSEDGSVPKNAKFYRSLPLRVYVLWFVSVWSCALPWPFRLCGGFVFCFSAFGVGPLCLALAVCGGFFLLFFGCRRALVLVFVGPLVPVRWFRLSLILVCVWFWFLLVLCVPRGGFVCP